MRKKVIGLLAMMLGIGLLVSGVRFSTAEAHTSTLTSGTDVRFVRFVLPLTAGALISHDLVVINSTKANSNLGICAQWWDGSPSHASMCAGSTAWLAPGESSKARYGWADVDAVFLPGDRRLKQDISGPDYVVIGCTRSYRQGAWWKVAPGVFEHTKKFYTERC